MVPRGPLGVPRGDPGWGGGGGHRDRGHGSKQTRNRPSGHTIWPWIGPYVFSTCTLVYRLASNRPTEHWALGALNEHPGVFRTLRPPMGPGWTLANFGKSPGYPPGYISKTLGGPLGGPWGVPWGVPWGYPGGSSGGSPGDAPGGFWVDSGLSMGPNWGRLWVVSGVSSVGTSVWATVIGHRNKRETAM